MRRHADTYSSLFFREDGVKKNALFMGLLYGLLGFAGNWLNITLFLDVEFLFGSFFVMLAIIRHGMAAGVIAGGMASSCTFLPWNHPWAMAIFSAEALFVAWRRDKKGNRERLLAGDFDGYLPKPLVVDQLTDCLAALCPAGAETERPEEPGKEEASPCPAPWPESLAGVDLADVMRRFDGDWEFYGKLLEDFARGYGGFRLDVEKALDCGDAGKARDLAHTLKGVAAYLSMNEVRELALRLEMEIASGADASARGESIAMLGKAIEKVISVIGCLAGREL